MNINHFSGLQIMQEMCNGNRPMPSMATTIPMSASEVILGHVTFLVKADERHLDPMGEYTWWLCCDGFGFSDWL